MAIGDPQRAKGAAPSRDTWLATLGDVFTRVVLFSIEGTIARVTGVKGLSELLIGTTVPLIDQTPLRWAIEAASPIVGAGRSPSGAIMASLLSLGAPRAFAVVPLVANKKLAGLAYGDCGAKALPLSSVADVFAACERLLNPHVKSALPDRVAFRSTSRREARITRSPKPNVAPRDGIRIITLVDESDERPTIDATSDAWNLAEMIEAEVVHEAPPALHWVSPLKQRAAAQREPASVQPRDTIIERSERGFRRGRRLNPQVCRGTERPLTASPFQNPAPAEPVTALDLYPFSAPQLVEAPRNAPTSPFTEVNTVELGPKKKRQSRVSRAQALSVIAMASVIAFTAGVLSPRSTGNVNERVVTLPAEAGAGTIGSALADVKLVRNSTAFAVIGGLTGAHDLRAGTYRIATGRWPWQVAIELRRGERDLLDVTIPEGLTLAQVAKRLEVAKIAQADTFIAAAHSPSLLNRYGIPGTDAQGWLGSGPYAMARGIGAPDVAGVMIDRFKAVLAALPETKHLEPDALNDVLTLASIVEREAKDKSESARIAGLFTNRLRLGMRLESRATALYILGTEKRELTLADVRQASPYNTFLNAGLPPAPIANPSLDAVRAALHPEEHGYFYMIDRDDGSGQHVFSATYEEHLRAQRENR